MDVTRDIGTDCRATCSADSGPLLELMDSGGCSHQTRTAHTDSEPLFTLYNEADRMAISSTRRVLEDASKGSLKRRAEGKHVLHT